MEFGITLKGDFSPERTIALTRQGRLVADSVIQNLAVAGGWTDMSLPIMG